jgi:hypothetical protein
MLVHYHKEGNLFMSEEVNDLGPVVSADQLPTSLDTGTGVPAQSTRTRRTNVSKEQFIQTFNDCANLSEVAERLGMNKASIATRASMYRKAGVELKKFSRGKTKVVA